MPEHVKLANIDMLMARQLESGLSTADFTPLPVLGVLGWESKHDEIFYDVTSVFRPKRMLVTRLGAIPAFKKEDAQ